MKRYILMLSCIITTLSIMPIKSSENPTPTKNPSLWEKITNHKLCTKKNILIGSAICVALIGGVLYANNNNFNLLDEAEICKYLSIPNDDINSYVTIVAKKIDSTETIIDNNSILDITIYIRNSLGRNNNPINDTIDLTRLNKAITHYLKPKLSNTTDINFDTVHTQYLQNKGKNNTQAKNIVNSINYYQKQQKNRFGVFSNEKDRKFAEQLHAKIQKELNERTECQITDDYQYAKEIQSEKCNQFHPIDLSNGYKSPQCEGIDAIKQIEATQQKGLSCGYWSISNSLVLQKIIDEQNSNEKLLFTPEIINDLSCNIMNTLIKESGKKEAELEQLYEWDITEIAEKFGLKNFCVLSSNDYKKEMIDFDDVFIQAIHTNNETINYHPTALYNYIENIKIKTLHSIFKDETVKSDITNNLIEYNPDNNKYKKIDQNNCNEFVENTIKNITNELPNNQEALEKKELDYIFSEIIKDENPYTSRMITLLKEKISSKYQTIIYKNKCLQLIQDTNVCAFIARAQGHWTTFVVYTNQNNKKVVIHMDSSNNSIGQYLENELPDGRHGIFTFIGDLIDEYNSKNQYII